MSHETIYRTLFIQARGALKKELVAHLRSRRTMRRSQNWSQRGKGKGQIDRRHLHPRATGRSARPCGAWSLGGRLADGLDEQPNRHAGRTDLAVHHPRAIIGRPMPSRDPVAVARALAKQIVKLPAHLRRSLTWDRGMEMAHHAEMSVATAVDVVYFCDPYRPWQRGTNENTNHLLRQYFPKGQRA